MRLRAKIKENKLVVRIRLPLRSQIDQKELAFFTRKCIHGFLKPQKNTGYYMVFSGPVAIPLSERLEQPIDKYDFFYIIEQIIEAVRMLLTNELSCKKVIWNTNRVFINKATKELQLLYLPLKSLEQPDADVKSFIESVVYSAEPVDDRDTDFVARFSRFLRNTQAFDPEKVERFIRKECPKAVSMVKKQRADSNITDKTLDYLKHKEKKDEDEDPTDLLDEDELTDLLDETQEADTALLEQTDEEATGLLDEDGTALLPDPSIHYPTLVRVRTGETITVNMPVFRIGRERGNVEYCIADNLAISRAHADIITRGDRYFVEDQNADNKTYLNGRMIPSLNEIEIINGDHLKLANEDFVFNT